jgi:predicted 3-demethylubiquinone-9 3-methyltransferase (glyoxalase superfamily)
MQKVTTFLMFDGRAEEAMNFYSSLFDQSEIVVLLVMERTKLEKKALYFKLYFL